MGSEAVGCWRRGRGRGFSLEAKRRRNWRSRGGLGKRGWRSGGGRLGGRGEYSL